MKNRAKQKAKELLSNIICYLWKHDITFNDSGCDVCGRCNKHEYYDSDFHKGKPIFKFLKLISGKYEYLRYWYKQNILKELPF